MAHRDGLSAFNDNVTVNLVPQAGWTFVYNVNADIVKSTLVASGTVTHDDAMAEVNSGAASSSSALLETRRILRYISGFGGLLRCTAVFDTPKEGNIQRIGLRNANNHLAMGFQDLEFGIFHRRNGSLLFIPEERFNGEKLNFDYTNGTVFYIQYQWLGFGAVRWLYETPKGEFEVMHTREYPNSEPTPSLVNPSMRVFAESVNTTNDTNVVLKTSSSMAFREGGGNLESDPLMLVRAFQAAKTVTVEKPVIAIRAKATYQSITNMLSPLMGRLGFSTDGTKSVTFKIYRSAVLTAADWTEYDVDVSSLEFDIAATAFSDGSFLFAYELSKIDSFTDDVAKWNIYLEPNEVLLITATSVNTSEVAVSVLMQEPF